MDAQWRSWVSECEWGTAERKTGALQRLLSSHSDAETFGRGVPASGGGCTGAEQAASFPTDLLSPWMSWPSCRHYGILLKPRILCHWRPLEFSGSGSLASLTEYLPFRDFISLFMFTRMRHQAVAGIMRQKQHQRRLDRLYRAQIFDHSCRMWQTLKIALLRPCLQVPGGHP